MMKPSILCAALALVTVASITSCGKKGPIEPPIIKTPQKVEIWDCFQRGNKLICEWVNPTTTVDGSPLRGTGEVEIWILKQDAAPGTGSTPLKPGDMEKQGKLAARISKDKFESLVREKRAEGPLYSVALDFPGDFNPSTSFLLAVRIKDEKKRESDFSEFRTVLPQILPPPPAAAAATVYEDRIEVRWRVPEAATDGSSQPKVLGYNIYREEEKQVRLLNPLPVKDLKYEDRDFVFDRKYRYFVRATASEAPPYRESDDSEVLEVLPKDAFPPRPPSGVQSIAGKGFISMSWEAGGEKDLAGYEVWRREDTEEKYWLLTPQPVLENTFTDTSVAKGKRYYYAICARDKSGNASDKTEVLIESLKEDGR